MSSQNVSTTIVYMAYNTSTGAYVIGDVSNHTIKLVKDGTEASPTNNPSEVDSTNAPGAYKLTLTAGETQYGAVWCGGKSSTPNVIIIPTTISFEILPTSLDGNGMVKADLEDVAGTTLSTHTSGMIPSDLRDISGSQVSTSSAQLGVNAVNIGGNPAPSFPSNFSSMSIDASGNVAITSNIKKNTAINNFPFQMTDSTTHQPKTGLTVTATRNIDGGGFSSCANAASEIGNGWYQINLAATDTNGNRIALRFTSTGADDRDITLITQP